MGITKMIVSDRRPVFAVTLRVMMLRTLGVSAGPDASVVGVDTLPTLGFVRGGWWKGTSNRWELLKM